MRRPASAAALMLILTTLCISGGLPGSAGTLRAPALPAHEWSLGFSSRGPVAATLPHPAELPLGTNATVILPNGTVSGPSSILQRLGNVYRLTSSGVGNLIDERNGSTLDGGGFTLSAANESNPGVEVYFASGVRVENLSVASNGTGVLLDSATWASVNGVRLNTSGWAIDAEGSSNLSLTNTTAVGSWGAHFDQDTNVTVSQNDLEGSVQEAISVSNSSSVRVSSNDLANSTEGVIAVRTDRLTVAGNDMSGDSRGLVESSVATSRIESNTLTLDGIAIWANGSSGITGGGNVGSGGGTGLVVTNSTDVTFVGGTFSNFAQAADCSGDLNLTLTGLSLPGSGSGVEIQGSTNVLIRGANLSGFLSVGLSFDSSYNVTAQSNLLHSGANGSGWAISSTDDRVLIVASNQAEHDFGALQDRGTSTLTIEGNDFSHSTGGSGAVDLSGENRVLVQENNLSYAAGAGLSGSSLRALTMVFNLDSWAGGDGISLTGLVGGTLQNDTLDHAARVALNLSSSSGVVVENDILSSVISPNGSGFLGTALVGGEVAFDVADYDGSSFAVLNSTDTLVLDNNGSYSGTGFVLDGDGNVTVAGNWFYHDRSSFSASENRGSWVYHNNFIDDLGWSVSVAPQTLHWDAGYPEGGNFWGNHTGPDLFGGPSQTWQGPDGIVDTPVPIGTSNADHYPITSVWYGYVITFAESGLTGSPLWGVTVNGRLYTSTYPTIVVPQTNGPDATYQFQIHRVQGYTIIEPTGGPYPEERTNITLTATFTPFLFPVTFQEYGLGPGIRWSIVIGSNTFNSGNATVQTMLANGSYNYLASKVSGYLPQVAAGVLYVVGQASQVPIVYTVISPAAGSSTPVSTPVALGIGLVVGVAAAWLVFGPLERRRGRRGTPRPNAVDAPPVPADGGSTVASSPGPPKSN